MRVLGIDPGLRRTGWGMIALEGNHLRFLACGSLATDEKETLAARLLAIHQGLSEIVKAHAPHEAAVEKTFVNKDAAATLKLGQARGIALELGNQLRPDGDHPDEKCDRGQRRSLFHEYLQHAYLLIRNIGRTLFFLCSNLSRGR